MPAVEPPRLGLGLHRARAISAFSPLSRACVGWWKAASANMTLSVADVTSWADLSGNAHPGVTPGFGANPLFIATDSSIAGHASIEFDQTNGDGEALDANGVGALVTGPFTVSCTARVDSMTTFGALWSIHDTAGGAYVYNGTENLNLIHVTSEDDTVPNGGTGNFASGNCALDTSWHVYTVVVTPRVAGTAGSFTFYIDGALKTMTDNTIEARLSFNAFKIAMSDGYALEGRIAELAVYNEAFDATTVRSEAVFMASDKAISIP